MDMKDLKANWQQVKGSMREHFGSLTDDDMMELENLTGKLQERYNLTHEEAESVITGLKLDDDGNLALATSIEGEGSSEAARRYQDAQHKFAAQNPVTKN